MKKKLIYESQYPRIDYMKQYEQDKAEVEKGSPIKNSDATDFLKAIRANTQYTPIPKRIAESESFINEAIEVSKLYEIDARIVQYDEKFSAYICFDFGADMQYVARLFGMADRISFFKDKSEHDFAVCLDFYTHVVSRNGMAIAP